MTQPAPASALAQAQKALRACQAAAKVCAPHWDPAFAQAWRVFGAELEVNADEGDEFASELAISSAALVERVARTKDEL